MGTHGRVSRKDLEKIRVAELEFGVVEYDGMGLDRMGSVSCFIFYYEFYGGLFTTILLNIS